MEMLYGERGDCEERSLGLTRGFHFRGDNERLGGVVGRMTRSSSSSMEASVRRRAPPSSEARRCKLRPPSADYAQEIHAPNADGNPVSTVQRTSADPVVSVNIASQLRFFSNLRM